MWFNGSATETLSLFSSFSWGQSLPLQWRYVKVLTLSLKVQHCYSEGADTPSVMSGPRYGSTSLTSWAGLKGSWKATSISDLWKPGKNPHHFPVWWGNQSRGKGNSIEMKKQRHQLIHNIKTIPGSQSNTEMGISKRFGIHNQGTKPNFSNWSVLGNAEIMKLCYKEFSLGQCIFFQCKRLQIWKSTATQNQYSSMTSTTFNKVQCTLLLISYWNKSFS